MLAGHATRGLKAGTVAGAVFGAFVALIGDPLVRHAEVVTTGHSHASEAGTVLASATSVAAGSLWGILLGLCFGITYYFAEPALPGGTDTGSYLLGVAGFVTFAGAPWLVLPPQPAGVESALGADARLGWYVVMLVAGAVACGLSVAAYAHTSDHDQLVQFAATAVPFALPLGLAAVAPATATGGHLTLAVVYRGVVGLGQVLLWGTLAITHAWFCRHSPIPRTVFNTSTETD